MVKRKRKTTVTTNKSAAKAPKKRRATTAARRKKGSGSIGNFFVPLFLMFGILASLGFLLFMGYRTVTASEFFDVKAIEINGVKAAPVDEIERIVRSETEKSGAWNADLKEIKTNIEKLIHVKSAVVSRVLPDGIRVNVIERTPRAIVRIGGGDFLADDDAVILGEARKTDELPPFFMTGWNREGSDKARRENQERVKTYLKMAEEWKEYDLAKRVEAVDLSDVSEPQAIVRNAGELKKIILSKDNFSRKLKSGLEQIAGKGAEVIGINVTGTQSFLIFRNKQNS